MHQRQWWTRRVLHDFLLSHSVWVLCLHRGLVQLRMIFDLGRFFLHFGKYQVAIWILFCILVCINLWHFVYINGHYIFHSILVFHLPPVGTDIDVHFACRFQIVNVVFLFPFDRLILLCLVAWVRNYYFDKSPSNLDWSKQPAFPNVPCSSVVE